MKRSDVDVGTARLEKCAPPLRTDSWQKALKLGALNEPGCDRVGDFGKLIAREMKIAARAKKAVLGKFGRRSMQEIMRCGSQLRDVWPAVALKIKSCRAAGRMIAALVFSLDDQG